MEHRRTLDAQQEKPAVGQPPASGTYVYTSLRTTVFFYVHMVNSAAVGGKVLSMREQRALAAAAAEAPVTEQAKTEHGSTVVPAAAAGVSGGVAQAMPQSGAVGSMRAAAVQRRASLEETPTAEAPAASTETKEPSTDDSDGQRATIEEPKRMSVAEMRKSLGGGIMGKG